MTRYPTHSYCKENVVLRDRYGEEDIETGQERAKHDGVQEREGGLGHPSNLGRTLKAN